MIKLTSEKTNLFITVGRSDYAIFSKTVATLRSFNCRWNKTKNCWVSSIFNVEKIKEALEDIDIVEDNIDYKSLEKSIEIPSQQEYEPIRRIPDYSLLNYPPITGKHPYENFQKEGIAKGINRSRYYYAWDCGSGKSYVAAAIIAHRLYKYKDCSKVLFITSNIGVRNLYNELFKFIKDLKEDQTEIADKTNRNPFDHNADIVMTSYNSFRLICDYYKKQQKITAKSPRKPFLPLDKWSNNKPIMLILDESHCIDSPTSQQSSLIRLHADCFKYRYFFSATPFDKIEKQWSPLFTLDPSIVYGLKYNEWLAKLANIGTYFSAYAIKDWKMNEVEAQNRRFLAGYGNYYKTTDLVDLPFYNEKKIYLKMQPKHRDIYEEVVVQSIPSSGTTKDVMNLFPFMMLAVDCPDLLLNHKDRFSDKLNRMLDTFKSSYLEKLYALDDIVADHPKEKILVWASHPSSIKMIAERYSKLNPIVITGETPQAERNELLEQFKHGDSLMLCGNISCLNTSVTLTECACQVYFSQSFNFTEVAQSRCRIYRVGQTREVESYILLYDRSLDCLLEKNIDSKGMLLEGLCKKEFLTQDQWKNIFNSSEDY